LKHLINSQILRLYLVGVFGRFKTKFIGTILGWVCYNLYFISDVAHSNEQVRLSVRDKISLQPPKAKKNKFFESDRGFTHFFTKVRKIS